jgi:hypothetical protein
MKRALAILCTVAAIGCEAASSDPGLAAELRVRNGRYAPGPLPEAGDGPEIVALRVPHDQILPGARSEQISGSLAPEAGALLIARAGDPGHWIVTAGAPALEEPDLPSFSAELSFARDAGRGTRVLALSAVGRDGRVGPRREVQLSALERTLPGELVVRLGWDTNADLDLHVITPQGDEIWAGDINSFRAPAPGTPPGDPQGFREGGILDLDSNADCVIDGRREENVVFAAEPPRGSYLVRVAAASLCDVNVAHWQVDVWLAGERVARAAGTSLGFDTRVGSGLGAGVEASRFDVP